MGVPGSDSEGEDDWTPSDMTMKPSPRSTVRQTARSVPLNLVARAVKTFVMRNTGTRRVKCTIDELEATSFKSYSIIFTLASNYILLSQLLLRIIKKRKPTMRIVLRHTPRLEPSARSRRAPDPLPEPKRPIRLNVKPPSRLRNVTGADADDDEDATPAGRTSLSRSSKQNKRPIVDKPLSESEPSEEEDDESAMSKGEDDEEDAEGSDVGMSDEAPAPAPQPTRSAPTSAAKGKIKLNNPYAKAAPAPAPAPVTKTKAARKPSPKQALNANGKVESVEKKEVRMTGVNNADLSDSDISSLDSPPPGMKTPPPFKAFGADDDAEGDSEEEEDDEDEEMEDAEGDSDDAIRASQIDEDDLGSASDESGTPDPNKMTRRQRNTSPSGLLALSNEAQKKKFFTAEQM